MEKETMTTNNYSPRPMNPEDKSYREVMMLFSDQPVKPKYWFEDFGDYWSCSCGQINRDETCSNCGLGRELLRNIFVLHKPNGKKSEARSNASDPGATPANAKGNSKSPDTPDEEAMDPKAAEIEDTEPDESDEEAAYRKRKRRTRRIMIVLIILIVLLGGGLAGFYYYALPELDRQNDMQADAAKESLIRSLPATIDPIRAADFDIYRNSGDEYYDKKEYEKAIEQYNKALEVKQDESVKQKILAAKFSYVSTHQEEGGNNFKKYLDELYAAKYTGIQEIYERHYTWKASIVANTGASDYSTDMDRISRMNIIYFHTTLDGGPPDEELDLYYEIIWPDGTSERRAISSNKSSGDTVTTQCQYTFAPRPGEGRLTYKLYNNSDHKMLATDSVTLSL